MYEKNLEMVWIGLASMMLQSKNKLFSIVVIIPQCIPLLGIIFHCESYNVKDYYVPIVFHTAGHYSALHYSPLTFL